MYLRPRPENLSTLSAAGGAVRDGWLGCIRGLRLFLPSGLLELKTAMSFGCTGSGVYVVLFSGPLPFSLVVVWWHFLTCLLPEPRRCVEVENTVKQLLYMAGAKDIRGSYP